VKLALRRGAAEGASTLDRLLSWVIKTRLVTRFPHAGIVIGDTLYHSTGRKGLHADVLDSADWVLIDIGGDDERALGLFHEYRGSGYDWVSLLAFVGIKARDSRRMYCYEWCYLAMTGKTYKGRVTPELLLAEVKT
jgi:hypothetical protein